MASGAGHDTAWMARITKAAMIFIPCRDGRSHSPDEFAETGDIALGAAVLLEAVQETGRDTWVDILTEKDVEPAVKGGSVYAAGGGGWADHGRMLGYAAVSVGKPELVDIEELDPKDWVATAAAIGAPASTTPWEMRGVDYVKAVKLLQDELGEKLAALMIGQNGKSSTLNALAARRRARHQGGRRGRRRPRASDRRHGLDRPRRFAQADDPDRGRRQPRREPLHRARGQRRDRKGLADPAHRGRPVRRLHRLLPQSGPREIRARSTPRSAASRWR